MSDASPCTTVCRICLAIDARTFPLSGTHLHSVFEKLTSTALHTQDQRPVAACYICYHQLLKSYKLIQMSVKAEDVLTDIFKRCNKITKQSISLINRNATSLSGYLCFSNVDYYSTLPPENESNEMEIDVKLEMAEDQDNIETDMDKEEADVDSAGEVPLFGATEHHTTDTKEEDPDGETTYVNETDIPKKSEQHFIPRVLTSKRRHKCNICLKRYKKRHHLHQHLLVHSDEKPFKCRLCGSGFRRKYHLDRHLLAIHKEHNPTHYKCDKCGSDFENRTLFRKHRRTHVYECDFCQQQITKRPEFIYHLKTHTGDNKHVRQKRDDICNDIEVDVDSVDAVPSFSVTEHHTADTKEENPEGGITIYITETHIPEKSEQHLIPKASTSQRRHKCNICQKRFINNCHLQRHLMVHSDEKPFQCRLCGSQFRTKSHLDRHLLAIHKVHNPTHYKCDKCGSDFKDRTEFRKHMRTHVYECDFCHQQITKRPEFIYHLRTHTGEKFECNICQVRFFYKSALWRHLKKHKDNKHVGERRDDISKIHIKDLECSVCQQSFKEPKALKNHMRIHVEARLECNICQVTFSEKSSLKRHLRKQHIDNKHAGERRDDICNSKLSKLEIKVHSKTHKQYLECSVCQQIFKTPQGFHNHLRVHTGGRFECNICHVRFSQKLSLSCHLKEHLDNKHKGETRDDICDGELSELEIKIHSKIHKKYLKCSVCQQGFDRPSLLVEHMRKHTGERPFECNECGKRFATKPSLKAHLKIHSGERPHKCNLCAHAFIKRGELNRHMRKHTGEKPFECNFCQRRFSFKHLLALHMRTHTGEKPEIKKKTKIHKQYLECPVCQQSFERPCLLVDHIRKHTGERPFECNECRKRFATKRSLREHFKIHSGERPHKCNHCAHAFIKRGELNRHMRTHTGEKAFECSVCQRRFRFKHILTYHMRTHTGEKPFECSVCGKRFIARTYLSRHILKTHKV